MIRKNLFSILVALVMLYLSLASSEKFEKVPLINIPFIDKIVHFGMYFVLTSVIIIEHRKSIKSLKTLFIISIFPLAYGILIEILQTTLTSSRSGDIFDALLDAAGILAAVFLWILFRPERKEAFR